MGALLWWAIFKAKSSVLGGGFCGGRCWESERNVPSFKGWFVCSRVNRVFMRVWGCVGVGLVVCYWGVVGESFWSYVVHVGGWGLGGDVWVFFIAVLGV